MNAPNTAPVLDLVRLSAASFAASVSADDINDDLMRKLGVQTRNVIARLAIARSLSVRDAPPSTEEKGGRTIKGDNLFGDDLRTWIVLLLEHDSSQTMSDVASVQDLVRRHWLRGLSLLKAEWDANEGDFNRFLFALASHAGFTSGGTSAAEVVSTGEPGAPLRARPVALRIGEIGEELTTRERIEWTINGPGRSPHIAIMGTLGTGKTRTAVSMMKSLRTQAGCPVIVFDMGKGDLSTPELADALGARVIDPIRQPIPLDFLYFDENDSSGAINAAMRFRESFVRVPQSRLGGAQLDILREAAQRALSGKKPVRLRDVRDRLREVYAERKRKDDVATATFNDMMSWQLFEPSLSPDEFFKQSWIIDVHTAPDTAQRLVVFLLLDALQSYLTRCGDTPLDAQHNRALRTVLVIDEARKVLAFEQQSLIGLVRESRSKGGAVMMISQSPDDFDGVEEDFLENIGLGIVFRTNARPASLNRMLGQNVDLGVLKDGVCVTRLVDKGLVRVQAWQPVVSQ